MSRRRFSTCLNKEAKAYNYPVLALIGAATCGAALGLAKGMMWAFGGGAAGFVMGAIVSRQWHEGNIQRFCYWYLPGQKVWIDKNVPESHLRRIL